MSQLIKRITKKGFTLIELMIVVAIIGILAAIAIPKFADLITKSKESAAKGVLGTVRGAVTIYYSDTEGVYPLGDSLASLATSGKYLDSVPLITIPRQSTSGSATPGHGALASSAVTSNDLGGYVYATTSGYVAVNCTHVDTKGSSWCTW
jgi:prepilin-type N-terminal cleavage/methylation domain-containing protein